jgi:hypothetical protein
MRLNCRGFSRIRFKAGITVAVAAVFVGTACSSSSSSSSSGSFGDGEETTGAPSSAAPAATQSAPAAEPSCSDQGYSPITFFDSGGQTVGGLTGCTSSDQPQTIIENTSEDTVWFVSSPSFPYWTATSDLQDFDSDLISPTTALFRIGIRYKFSEPLLTIEPDTTVTLPTAPGTIQLKQDPGEQATWGIASLLVNSASDKAEDAIVSLLKEGASKTDSAMITCMYSGYSIGEQLAEQGDSDQEIQSQLSSELGIAQSSQECGEAIDEAEKESEKLGEAPELKLGNVVAETNKDRDYEDAGSVIREAEEGAHDLLRLHD